ncbi:hypothetical protein [Ancylobacter polymorphus]|uniref:DUF4412 domain-containing protein n=1 Tax=Ancylobacter polymorphus TaxID=223390 RepID=A0A9E7A963_9HYPH|nr:hypothetical protein [Ancylobacter polymorphus]UOK72018.1 hypothetical protein K9D25_04675 [Ancylobacter polymorphus]
MRHYGIASLVLGIGLSIDLSGASADPMPAPAADYHARARALPGVELSVAHHQGKVRVEVERGNLPNGMVSLIDLPTSSVIVMVDVPGMDRIAVETDMPPGFAFSDAKRQGTRAGKGEVLGEACDLWRFAVPALNQPVESCITADGIVLRTTTQMNGKPVVLFEVTELSRTPQDPATFALPKGMKPSKIPPSMRALLPGLVR